MLFGAEGWDHVPISLAVQASTALPGLYPPVRVDGIDCVDGVLLRTVHASVALEQGVELLLCVNPIVPTDVRTAIGQGLMPKGILAARGLPAVLSQTFRTLIHSRLEVGLSRYATHFPDADIVLFEPGRDEYAMFFSNVFSFSSRREVCELAYRNTRAELWERRRTLGPALRAPRPEAAARRAARRQPVDVGGGRDLDGTPRAGDRAAGSRARGDRGGGAAGQEARGGSGRSLSRQMNSPRFSRAFSFDSPR